MSDRLATGIRKVIPGSKTEPRGRGRIGRVWDFVRPISLRDGNKRWVQGRSAGNRESRESFREEKIEERYVEVRLHH